MAKDQWKSCQWDQLCGVSDRLASFYAERRPRGQLWKFQGHQQHWAYVASGVPWYQIMTLVNGRGMEVYPLQYRSLLWCCVCCRIVKWNYFSIPISQPATSIVVVMDDGRGFLGIVMKWQKQSVRSPSVGECLQIILAFNCSVSPWFQISSSETTESKGIALIGDSPGSHTYKVSKSLNKKHVEPEVWFSSVVVSKLQITSQYQLVWYLWLLGPSKLDATEYLHMLSRVLLSVSSTRHMH